MTDFKTIYANHAAQYDRMVAREDHQGNILPAIHDIGTLSGADVVELGAGTGRLTRLLAPHVAAIHAFDASAHMLGGAVPSLARLALDNWTLAVGDNRALPVREACCDIAIEGWSFGHFTGWYPDTWRDQITQALAEMRRVLRPGGVAILFETMGTGTAEPGPPAPGLGDLYRFWEDTYGFASRVIRTDYRFASVEEAADLTRFFFGDTLADRILREKLTVVPEWTGVWWKTL